MEMEIKILLDAALEAGINLNNEDSVHDCADVWLETFLNDHEWVADWLPEFLSDLDALDLHKIASDSHKAYQDTQWLQDYSKGNNHTGLNLAYCGSATMRANNIGALIVKRLIAGTKTVVAENLQEWYWECRRYALEAEQCHEEDAKAKESRVG